MFCNNFKDFKANCAAVLELCLKSFCKNVHQIFKANCAAVLELCLKLFCKILLINWTGRIVVYKLYIKIVYALICIRFETFLLQIGQVGLSTAKIFAEQSLQKGC